MLSHKETNAAWEKALRAYALEPLMGEQGPYLPIGAKSMALLDPLWKAGALRNLPDIGAMLKKGADVRVFGDPHFEHANIIRMCERPFSSIGEMDEALWSAVERAHQQADFVICLGDWSMKNPISWARKVASAFPQKCATVVGNHDAKGSKPAQWIQTEAYASLAFTIERDLAQSWVAIREPELCALLDWKSVPRLINVGVSHWPVPPSGLPGPGWINLHGHIHNRPNRPLRVNCSLEAIGFEPKRIEDLIDARVLGELARRQGGLAGFEESEGSDPGDSSSV